MRRRRLARDGAGRARGRAVGARDGRAGGTVRVELVDDGALEDDVVDGPTRALPPTADHAPARSPTTPAVAVGPVVGPLVGQEQAPEPAPDPAPGRRRPGHPVRWAAAAVVVALAGSFVAAQALERARTVDVRSLAGGLAPLESMPDERWSVPVDPGGSVLVGPGVVVTLGDALTAYAVDDGSRVWRSEAVDDDATCEPRPDRSPRAVVVCVAPTPARGVLRLTTVDSASGRTLGTREVAAVGRAVVPVGERDVVRARWVDDGLRLVREDPVTGTARWERQVAREQVGAGLADDEVGDGVVLDVSRGVVTVMAPGVVATLTEDGRVLEQGDVWNLVRLADGRYAGNEYGRGTTTVFSASGEPQFDVRGRVLEPVLSDGSAPGVLVTNTFDGVAGVDAATGGELWRIDGTGLRPVLRVDEMMVLRTETSLRAVDVTTGTTRWDVPLADGTTWPVLTDGRSVLVTEGQRGRHEVLVAVGLDDGAVGWRWTMPGYTYQVFTAEGRLFVLGPERLTAVS